MAGQPRPSHDLIITTASRHEMQLFIDAAAAEGWSPGRHDAAAFYSVDEGGFFIGRLGDEVVAFISSVCYNAGSTDSRFGFVGFYIVKLPFRGRGFGMRMWKHALARLKVLECHSVGLDAVLHRVDDYAKSGFLGSYAQACFNFAAAVRAVPAPPSIRVVPWALTNNAAVFSVDAEWFGYERSPLLLSFLSTPGVVGFVAIQSSGSDSNSSSSNSGDDRIAGYIISRPSTSGYKIGPLFARSSETADALLCAAASAIPAGVSVFIAVPSSQAAWRDAAAVSWGFKPAFPCERMYMGAPVKGVQDVVFAVATLELG